MISTLLIYYTNVSAITHFSRIFLYSDFLSEDRIEMVVMVMKFPYIVFTILFRMFC